MSKKSLSQLIIYQGKSGAIEFRGDSTAQTIWGTQKQISDIFDIDRSVVTKHIKNIFQDKELDRKSVCASFAHTAKDGKVYQTNFYSLDIILAVGYRTSSGKAIEFRKWATKVLKQHITKGYTINKKRIGKNYQKFMQAMAGVKSLLPTDNKVDTQNVLELINTFAGTWFSLDAYDTNSFSKKGITKKTVNFTANELSQALQKLKQELVRKKQAAEIFGQERSRNATQGIIGNIFQSVFGKDVYPTAEEKAAHLLYFMVKNHPFVDGNKRSGAFTFVWFLRKSGLLYASLTPEALTAFTLLIAESRPKDKDKMIGLIMLLLKK
jgi:prophage maintenance system killer protein